MKLFYVLVFTLISIVGFSQIYSFSKTTQLLDKPNGKAVFEVNAGVEYYGSIQKEGDLYSETSVPCYVQKTAIKNSSIEKGTILFDYTGSRIGIVLRNTPCDDQDGYAFSEYHPDSLQIISLTGFIEIELVNKKAQIKDVMKNKTGIGDSCVSRVFTYYNTIGEKQTIEENCKTYITWVRNNQYEEELLVKEKTITYYFLCDIGDFKTMSVEIIKDYNTDHPQSFFISNDGYKCDFDYNKIVFYEYNWSAGPEMRYLYSISTFKQLMTFHGELYTVTIPETNLAGFIGYLPVPNFRDSTYCGNLYFATPEKVLINKKIICNKKELVDSLTFFDSKIKFVPLNKYDAYEYNSSTRFILKSKMGCTMENYLTDFRIIMSLGYDDLFEIPIELEFRDGDVFIVKNYMDAFELQ